MKKKPMRRDGGTENYDAILGDVSTVVEAARRSAARSVNSIMTAAYWLIGHRLVEFEQGGKVRAAYGEELLERFSADLTARYGRGFSARNVWQMKSYYLAWQIPQTASAELHSGSAREPRPANLQTASGISATVSRNFKAESSTQAVKAIGQTLSDFSLTPITRTPSAKFEPAALAARFLLINPARIHYPIKHLDHAKKEVVAARYLYIPAEAIETVTREGGTGP